MPGGTHISVRLEPNAARTVSAREHGARDLQIVADPAGKPKIGALVCGEHALATSALAQTDFGRAVREKPQNGSGGNKVLAIMRVRHTQADAQNSIWLRLVDHFPASFSASFGRAAPRRCRA